MELHFKGLIGDMQGQMQAVDDANVCMKLNIISKKLGMEQLTLIRGRMKDSLNAYNAWRKLRRLKPFTIKS